MPGHHTEKEKRKAEHIKLSYMRKGMSEEEATRKAWMTVNSEKVGLGSLRRGGKGGQH